MKPLVSYSKEPPVDLDTRRYDLSVSAYWLSIRPSKYAVACRYCVYGTDVPYRGGPNMECLAFYRDVRGMDGVVRWREQAFTSVIGGPCSRFVPYTAVLSYSGG